MQNKLKDIRGHNQPVWLPNSTESLKIEKVITTREFWYHENIMLII